VWVGTVGENPIRQRHNTLYCSYYGYYSITVGRKYTTILALCTHNTVGGIDGYLVCFSLQSVDSGCLHYFLFLLQQQFFQPDCGALDFAVELFHVLETRPVRARNKQQAINYLVEEKWKFSETFWMHEKPQDTCIQRMIV